MLDVKTLEKDRECLEAYVRECLESIREIFERRERERFKSMRDV